MRHVRWLIPLVAALAVIYVWWAQLKGIVVLVAVVCGLAGLAYLVMRRRHPMPDLPAGHERDTRDVLRNIPPPSN